MKFGTYCIESRGARSKKIGDAVVCWRPMQRLTKEYTRIQRWDEVDGTDLRARSQEVQDQLCVITYGSDAPDVSLL